MEPNGHPSNHTEQNKRKNKILRPLQEPRKSKKINKLQKTNNFNGMQKPKTLLGHWMNQTYQNKINKIQKTEIFYGLRIPKTI